MVFDVNSFGLREQWRNVPRYGTWVSGPLYLTVEAIGLVHAKLESRSENEKEEEKKRRKGSVLVAAMLQ
jgi:hypothetical protein